jgi:hypothetical protein
MKLTTHVIVTIIMCFAFTVTASSAPFKTYVAEFSVSGPQAKDDLKMTLKGLLASRLNPEQVMLVKNKDTAELTITGSYTRFGRIFSLDVQIDNSIDNTLTRVFETGESDDDVLPAIARLSGKIERELAKKVPVSPPAVVPIVPKHSNAIPSPHAVTSASNRPIPAPNATIASAGTVRADSYQVSKDDMGKSVSDNWTSPPITGSFKSIAIGRLLANGKREIFIADDNSVRYYLKDSELKMVAEVGIAHPGKILSIDTADLDKDGIPELYVTIENQGLAASRVYVPKDNKLDLISTSLPWFLRGHGHDFSTRIVYAQELGIRGIFVKSAAELVKNGKEFSVKNAFKLQTSWNVFNFSRFISQSGKEYLVGLDEDSYLVIATLGGEEVWKSSNRYGGSEKNIKIEAADGNRTFIDGYRWTFLEQRIVMTPDGLLLVPHNEGMFTVGFSRSYTKYKLHALAWNGSSLKEKWHTMENQSYLADFAYDAKSRELILLEVVQKSGLFSKGKTVISINKVD